MNQSVSLSKKKEQSRFLLGLSQGQHKRFKLMGANIISLLETKLFNEYPLQNLHNYFNLVSSKLLVAIASIAPDLTEPLLCSKAQKNG